MIELVGYFCRAALAPELHAKGITPTVKNLRKCMQNPASLWHSEVLEVLSEVRGSLEQ
jgi:hypothetical protein